MCEYTAYLIQDDDHQPQVLMETVETVVPVADGLKLTNLFGEQKTIRARIHAVELIDHKIYLKS